MKGTKRDNCKFADDGTVWHTGQDLDCIRKKATEDIETSGMEQKVENKHQYGKV